MSIIPLATHPTPVFLSVLARQALPIGLGFAASWRKTIAYRRIKTCAWSLHRNLWTSLNHSTSRLFYQTKASEEIRDLAYGVIPMILL
ncbi:hypothetical protein COMA1_60189 [Candidatus Nitrospira nitrosa]|uniref:Uncharacterized protein n=1 Tax=Candidatus Nitrospira nitrosa TaxID=1742972 RepID=A0A0S4LR02_9BACT|nr:hypothetical protein COMA1_60189 [Candidatus Nitrospira nitrosa]